MGKIIITADIHFGIPKRLDDILWALGTIREYATKNEIENVVILGDLFHDRVNINIEVLTAAYNFFEETQNRGQSWTCFCGNHDMFLRNSWDVNSLHPLNKVLNIIENISLIKLLGARFWVVPFINYESVYMKAIERIETKHQEGDVLLTHVGVHNAILNECFLIRNWSIVNFDESKFDRVFTGHFHCHQNVSGRNNVWYPGSPVAFTFAEGAVEHGFIVYDTDTRDVEFVDLFELDLMPGNKPPKFITLSDTDIDIKKNIGLVGNNLRVMLTREYSRDELYRFRSSLKECGVKDIKWMQDKSQESDAGESKIQTELSVAKPDELFAKWLEHDKPGGLNNELLLKLNETVTAEAASRLLAVNEDISE